MELVFLVILIFIMVSALGAGFPVAFALPGSAILTIALAAITGELFAGDMSAYFAHGGPVQWLNAGVTNLRGIYWEVERDTLIAIPLFIFMGIMLERSKIAEDLLVTMGQLFGPVPGGVGISVVLVGALLAATTGIVGATVIAMGLISLPVMLRANYSHSLATGTICASGTLGQIIPPSIVLIILADQLSTATDQASALRTADYKLATGNTTLPSQFDLTSTSAGDMFLGAFLPGLVLVGLYITYILVLALLRPKLAPPAPYEGKFDRGFLLRVLVVLVPPLTLIFVVLGSIILGIATVNQAGAIGAIGAMIMAGYRLTEGRANAFYPAFLAFVSIGALVLLLQNFDINVKSIQTSNDWLGVILAAIASTTFVTAVIWSGWRVFKIGDTLEGVMVETAKTTSLVFIILLGAAMLTAAFRAFGGEDLVRDFLSGLPGGFATKFIVVMLVIFVLGFFLDFIEIAVVVVPIIAPILLADPSANVTAVWLGVMIGVNMQTSFLTPPFGFALFYLRGVAPPKVRTIEMYRGVVPFIGLQLLGLAIVGFFPVLVNYLPSKVYLTSDTAPPPKNPRLQLCIEKYLFDLYDRDGEVLRVGIKTARGLDFSGLPANLKSEFTAGLNKAEATIEKVAAVRAAETAVATYLPEFRPKHSQVRDLRVELGTLDREKTKLTKERRSLSRDPEIGRDRIVEVEQRLVAIEIEKESVLGRFPRDWVVARKKYIVLESAETKSRRMYRRNVDDAYEPVEKLRKLVSQTAALVAVEGRIKGLQPMIESQPPEQAIAAIAEVGSALSAAGALKAKLALSKAGRALKPRKLDRAKAMKEFAKALKLYTAELVWRRQLVEKVGSGLNAYDDAIKGSIGLSQQARLTDGQAGEVASCLSHHLDISLSF